MAVIIGTERNDRLGGTPDQIDLVFGDPYTGGSGGFRGIPDNGRVLSSGRGGNDTLGSDGSDFLFGDAWKMDGTGRGGNDRLKGDAAELIGDAVNIGGQARGGDDVLLGDDGRSRMFGDASGTLYDQARGGDDRLVGGSGSDDLWGDAPTLGGQARGGDDVLLGGGGDDNLWGDGNLREGATGGQDRFVFAPGSGVDLIFDFEAGRDQIDLGGLGLPKGARQALDTDRDGLVDDGDRHVAYDPDEGGLEIDLGAAAGGPAGADVVHVYASSSAVEALSVGDFAE